MKKDAPRQARRQRALARLTVNPARRGDAEYMAKKNAEFAALHSALGLPKPAPL